MFKNLKISTGITGVIASLTIFLMVVMAFSLFNAMSSKNNFTRITNSIENIDTMRGAAFNLNGGLAYVNALMLQTSLNRKVDPQAINTARDIFAKAQANMKSFMATPFNTEEEKQAAVDLNKQFDHVLSLAQAKLDYISDPVSSPDNLESESHERNLLRDKIDAYSDITSGLNDQYVSGAEEDYYEMFVMTIVVVSASVIMTLLIRIWLRRALVLRMEQTSQSIKVIAGGDLTQKIDTGNENELGLMLVELEKMRVYLTQTISGVHSGVNRIYTNAQEIAQGNNDLSARTEEQASALQETAASMEELKTTVRQNADNAHTARQLADSASANARKGGDVMLNLTEIMQQITRSSRQIADINGVIDSIANQTNILALNAAVEAARAGEQGRGFAVVAGEVRNLAKRSADAAKEISQLITVCVDNMTTGSQQVDNAGTVMSDIVDSVTQVTDIMGEITSASDEQSAGINQIAQAVNEMDQVTQQNAVMVEEAAVAANNLELQAETLEKIVSKFKINEQSAQGQQVTVRNTSSPRLPAISVKRSAVISKNTDEGHWETF
jgi:methyl-accepting chemotaxis protein